jgi:hypothetical protein
MLSSRHFYHRIIRKIVVGFGTMFNDIKLYRYTKDGQTEIERVTVPLSYMSKEKFYTRITQDPELNRSVQTQLPRMSFDMTAINYDPLRKITNFNQQFKPGKDGDSLTTITSTPYNFSFDLNIYVRNVEDGTQIVEQILPYFAPDHTIAMNLTGIQGDKVDVPIVLEGLSYDSEAVGSSDTTRVLTWTLTFTVQAFLYGFINDSVKIIRKSIANTFDSTVLKTGDQIVTLSSGFGQYKIGELVYVGTNLSAANASGFVSAWNNVANQIYVTDISGVLTTNNKLVGAVSNASYTIQSFVSPDNQLVNLSVTPTPNTANANNAFGFDEESEYFPNIT